MQAEEKILQLAMEKGLLTPALLSENIASLINKGILSEQTLSELRSEVESRMAAETSANLSNQSTKIPQIPKTEENLRRFGDFENLEFLGQGGMAKVYKAFDTKLGRLVALKVLRVEDSEMAERLLMEAKTQARIEHEHVCKVYEAGEVDGKPYIAMQLIKGKTLKDLRNELTLELKLKLMAEVADAVHSAHRAGMIHRDLKPANVMVERNEDGEYIPYVMDFGLAREAGTSGMTETGRLLGTIFYMSPEQARGHVRRLDRRSDVYSLGITLYELISEQLPYEQSSEMDFLINLVDETKSIVPRMPDNIPDDLETIVMKCVEKETKHRYESAKALADDLRRYLDGEPIHAKRANLFYTLSKKARKHRVVFSIASIGLISILVLLGLWMQTRRNAAERIKIAQELGQQVERVEAALRYTHLLPFHNASREIKEARSQVESIRLQIQNKEGGAGAAPSYYATGRGYLALGELDKAKEYLEKAWNEGYRTADVSYALGRTLGALYQREVEESEQTGTRLSRQLRRKQLEKEFRAPALHHLRQIKGNSLQAPDYYRALVAFYDGRYTESLREAEKAQSRIPWLYEGKRLQGDVYATQAREMEHSGNIQDALKLFNKAEEAYVSAVQIGVSDSENYERLCRMKASVVKSIFYNTTLEPKNEFEQAITYCDQASLANPENKAAPAARAMAFNRWGEYQLFNGQDPEPALRSAIASAEKAAAISPSDHFSQHNLGFSYSLLSNYRILKNRKPLEEIKKATEHYQNALKLKPKYTPSLSGIGLVYQYKAEYLISVGEDPKDSFGNSISYREQAVKNDTRNTDMMNNLGNAYDSYAVYLIESSGAPEDPSNRSIKTFQEAIQINPNEPLLRANLIQSYITRIRFLQMIGQEHSAELSNCIRSAEENIRLNPHHELSRYVLVESYLLQARTEINRNLSAEQSLKKAKEAVEMILRDAAETDLPHGFLGELELLLAKENMLRKKSPERNLKNAVAYLNKALDQSPMDQSILLLLGECHLEAAEWKQIIGQPLDLHLRDGLEVAQTILQKNSRSSEAYLLKAKLQATKMDAAEVKQSLEKALQLNRNLQNQIAQLSTQLHIE